jgi:AbrB family looped-hinge helix DNA binding protein
MNDGIAVRVDSKGRLTIPRRVREALGIRTGDLFFLQREGAILRYARAENPFDALAEHAVGEYLEGRTKGLRDFAVERGLPVDGG